MTHGTICRNLAVLLSAGAGLVSTQSVRAADERGSVQGVINDASGQPVTGAFVKLKNADRRLTFMGVSQARGQFEAKDLPAGTYSVQGVGAGYESNWFTNVNVVAGDSAKVGLALTNKQGAMLTPAWPKRLPQDQVAKVSKDAKDLPDGEGKALVAERGTTCHDVQRIAVKRSPRADWEHTIGRMRGLMATMNIPDLTDAQNTTILNYVS